MMAAGIAWGRQTWQVLRIAVVEPRQAPSKSRGRTIFGQIHAADDKLERVIVGTISTATMRAAWTLDNNGKSQDCRST